MDMHHFLAQLIDEIAADEAALNKKREMFDFVASRLQSDGGTVNVNSDPRPGNSVMLTTHPMPESFSESVLKAVKEIYHREFTAGDVFSILTDRGVKFNSSTPKASIATALGRLVVTGTLKMTFKGSGQIPNRFLRADAGSDQTNNDATEEEDDL